MEHADSLRPSPYRLENQIQHYAWGTRGRDAFIPQFLGIEGETGRPYAELWMGAHPRAPSSVILDGTRVPLDQLIARHPLEILGRAVAERFGDKLPFLFKVLSADEALSIQAHPTRAQAEVLHARDPEHYPDDNHKPEIAIALEPLTALVGLRGAASIRQVMRDYPEIAGFVGTEALSAAWTSRDPVRSLYPSLIRRSVTHAGQLTRATERLAKRLGEKKEPLTKSERIFIDAGKRYTGPDVGLFSIFLLNPVRLERGQGLFIEAGIPHAYLKGNIIECMANSDNVVRAGLTPKFRDVETLLDILVYDAGPAFVAGESVGSGQIVYRTAVPEFEVSRWRLSAGQVARPATHGRPAILLVTHGRAHIRWGSESGGAEMEIRQGQSVLIPACLKEYSISAPAPAPVELFEAGVPPGQLALRDA